MTGYYRHPRNAKKQRRFPKLLFGILLFAFIGFGSYVFIFNRLQVDVELEGQLTSRPSTEVQQEQPEITITVPMPWPGYGQAAYGIPGQRVFAISETDTKPVPIASLTKVITALAVLDKHPLEPGDQGPMITYTQADVDLFYEYLAKDGIVVPVEVGEQISLYQALQAILLVSANNVADTVVRWSFGSMESYKDHANSMLRNMGLEYTVADDASGFSPQSVSTAKEMTILGYHYMQNPVLREIAFQEGASIPVAGNIRSSNSFANDEGVVGIKIGFIEEAGRTYLVADVAHGEGSVESVSVAAVLGANDFLTAARDARAILQAGNAGSKLIR
jgi:serine-type D-Ala-D-Ala carboxypeptidase (penicillin-binding protein 5/6)